MDPTYTRYPFELPTTPTSLHSVGSASNLNKSSIIVPQIDMRGNSNLSEHKIVPIGESLLKEIKNKLFEKDNDLKKAFETLKNHQEPEPLNIKAAPKEDWERFHKYYNTVVNSDFPPYVKIRKFADDPKNKIFAEETPPSFDEMWGIPKEGPGLLMPLLFGTMYLIQAQKDHLIEDFLNEMLPQLIRLGIPCLRSHEGVNVCNLLALFNLEKPLKIIQRYFHESSTAGKLLVLQSIAVKQTNKEKTALWTALWNVIQGVSYNLTRFRNVIMKIRAEVKNDWQLAAEVLYEIPLMQYYVIFESSWPDKHVVKAFEQLLNLKESLWQQAKISSGLHANKVEFFLKDREESTLEYFLKQRVFSIKSSTNEAYCYKLLQGWSKNLLFLESLLQASERYFYVSLTASASFLCFRKLALPISLSKEELEEIARELISLKVKETFFGLSLNYILGYFRVRFEGNFARVHQIISDLSHSLIVVPQPISQNAETPAKVSAVSQQIQSPTDAGSRISKIKNFLLERKFNLLKAVMPLKESGYLVKQAEFERQAVGMHIFAPVKKYELDKLIAGYLEKVNCGFSSYEKIKKFAENPNEKIFTEDTPPSFEEMGAGVIPPLLFGIVHLIYTKKSHLVQTFLKEMLPQLMKLGIPCLMRYGGANAYNLLAYFQDKESLKILEASLNESVIREFLLNDAMKRSLNSGKSLQKRALWQILQGNSLDGVEFYKTCLALFNETQKDWQIAAEIIYEIPLIQYYLLFQSPWLSGSFNSPLLASYIDEALGLLENLKETIWLEEKAKESKEYKASLFTESRELSSSENFLRQCIFGTQIPALNAYRYKILQGWAKNIPLLEHFPICQQLYTAPSMNPLLRHYQKLTTTDFLSREELTEMAREIKNYRAASFGICSYPLLMYFAAKYKGNFAGLRLVVSEIKDNPPQDSVLNASVVEAHPSPLKINPSASWNIVYTKVADVFLSLLKRDDFLFALSQALLGKPIKISPELVEEIKKGMGEIQVEYQHHLSIDPKATKDALRYFFEEEMPCLKLLNIESFNIFSHIPSTQTPLKESKILIDAYLHQLGKVIEWKKRHLKEVHQSTFVEKEYLTLVISKKKKGSIEVHPAFFKFSDSMSLKGFRTDLQMASPFLKDIFSDEVVIDKDKVTLTKFQYEVFYDRLKRVGPYYLNQGAEEEFLLIPRGKIIVEKSKKIKQVEPHRNEKAKIAVRWSIPSVGRSDAFKSDNLFKTFLFSQAIREIDKLERKKHREEILSKGERFQKAPTDLSRFLAQETTKMTRVTKFIVKGLMPYQEESINFLLELYFLGLHGGLLGLDTGLGKTITIFGLFKELSKIQHNPSDSSRPNCYIGTKSTILQSLQYFRTKMGETKIQEMKSIADEFLSERSVEFTKVKHYGICLNQYLLSFKRTLESCRREEQISFAQDFVDKAKKIIEETGLIMSDETRGSIISEEDIQDYLEAYPDGSWDFNLFKDVLEADEWAKLPAKEKQGKEKIMLFTHDSFAKYQDAVIDVRPLSIVVDEAHNISNVETNHFKMLRKVTLTLEEQGNPTFTVFASATLFMHSIENLLAYLEIVTPKSQTKQADVISISDLSSIIPELLNKISQKFYKICDSTMTGKTVEEEVLFDLYANIKEAFSRLESFKQSLNAVAIYKLKTDKEIRRQWNNRIPVTRQVEHEFGLGETQENCVKIEKKKFKNGTTGNRNFLAYHRNIYKILFHPDIYLKPVDVLLKELRGKTFKELEEWSKPSPMLHYFLTSATFEKHAKQGALIFVNEISKGKVLKFCLKRRFNNKRFAYLTGKTSARRRQEMAQQFEAAKEGKPNIFFASSKAANAGMDLPKKGLHVYFTFRDFNPKEQEQGANRISRVNSDKKEVYVHNFSFPVSLQQTLIWHANKKTVTEDYFLSKFFVNQSNLLEHYKKMLKLIPYGIRQDLYTESLGEEFQKLINTMIQFAQEDQSFVQEIKLLTSQDKGKEKIKEDQEDPPIRTKRTHPTCQRRCNDDVKRRRVNSIGVAVSKREKTRSPIRGAKRDWQPEENAKEESSKRKKTEEL